MDVNGFWTGGALGVADALEVSLRNDRATVLVLLSAQHYHGRQWQPLTLVLRIQLTGVFQVVTMAQISRHKLAVIQLPQRNHKLIC
jgi:hypothetical protein